MGSQHNDGKEESESGIKSGVDEIEIVGKLVKL